MTELLFILTPLLVLPIILLFRFVGCAQIAGLEIDTGSGARSHPAACHSELSRHRHEGCGGHHRLLAAGGPVYRRIRRNRKARGLYRNSSDPHVTPGDFILGQNSLVQTKPVVSCRYYNGGYVIIPAHADLFTHEFTIEAWLRPDFGSGGNTRCFTPAASIAHRSTPTLTSMLSGSM